MAGEVVIRDFTVRDTTIKFKIYDHTFEAAPEMPLGVLQAIAKLQNVRQAIEDEGMEALLDVLDMFILDDSMAVIRRMVDDKRQPFGVRHMQEIIPWLLEQYGLRPTQPSSPSSDGSADGETGISGTDGVPASALTGVDSPSGESSISSNGTSSSTQTTNTVDPSSISLQDHS